MATSNLSPSVNVAGGLRGIPRITASTIRGISSCVRAGELVDNSTVGEGDSTEIDGLALFGSLRADLLARLRRPRGGALLSDADAFGVVAALVILGKGALAFVVFLVQAIYANYHTDSN